MVVSGCGGRGCVGNGGGRIFSRAVDEWSGTLTPGPSPIEGEGKRNGTLTLPLPEGEGNGRERSGRVLGHGVVIVVFRSAKERPFAERKATEVGARLGGMADVL